MVRSEFGIKKVESVALSLNHHLAGGIIVWGIGFGVGVVCFLEQLLLTMSMPLVYPFPDGCFQKDKAHKVQTISN